MGKDTLGLYRSETGRLKPPPTTAGPHEKKKADLKVRLYDLSRVQLKPDTTN